MPELEEYISNPESAEAIMNLARWYETRGHLSPACGLYLRAAEFSHDEQVSYECMIRLYYCYSQLGNRDYTCENIAKMALKMRPKSPEPYFLLSQLYERKENWMDSYLYASIGLEITDCRPSSLKFGSSYENEYMLVFQKAVAAWWYGRPAESRSILRSMPDKYGKLMSPEYLALVQNNISRIGSASDAESRTPYEASNYESFAFKFPGLKEIERNYSQVCQDLFVLAVLGGKKDGTYLEIGSAQPYLNSNTALLEQIGWAGVGIELKRDFVEQHTYRKNKVICGDALTANYKSILACPPFGEVVDYLQLDIEPPKNTFEALLSIPFDKHKFRVITYEHDHYADITRTYRDKSRRYLSSIGYTLVVNDVSPNKDCNFEDWWVMLDLVDTEMVDRIKSSCGEINEVRKLFFE